LSEDYSQIISEDTKNEVSEDYKELSNDVLIWREWRSEEISEEV
jgi:hypothetical protein